jgi:hypothetical protein
MTSNSRRQLLTVVSIVTVAAAAFFGGRATMSGSSPTSARNPTAAGNGGISSFTGTTITTEPTTVTTNPDAVVSQSVPVVACKTTFGVEGATTTVPPLSGSVAAPANLGGSLALYAGAVMQLLGPRGWVCSDVVGADGQSTLAIYPLGSPSPSASPFVPSNAEAIIGHETSASVGSARAIGCPLFSDVFAALEGLACQNAKPTDEKATYASAKSVRFVDPPGVAGDGAPSGGPYQAVGAMTTFPLSTNDGVWVDTCTLPSSERRICTSALDLFLKKYARANPITAP